MDDDAPGRGAPLWWASRTFSTDGWYSAQEQFEEDYEAAGEPSDMMMCRTEKRDRTTIYVGMPEPGSLQTYAGFETCPKPGGLVRPLLLMGDPDTFERLFYQRQPSPDDAH